MKSSELGAPAPVPDKPNKERDRCAGVAGCPHGYVDARNCSDCPEYVGIYPVSKAVADEREACAAIADALVGVWEEYTRDEAFREVAYRIRALRDVT